MLAAVISDGSTWESAAASVGVMRHVAVNPPVPLPTDGAAAVVAAPAAAAILPDANAPPTSSSAHTRIRRDFVMIPLFGSARHRRAAHSGNSVRGAMGTLLPATHGNSCPSADEAASARWSIVGLPRRVPNGLVFHGSEPADPPQASSRRLNTYRRRGAVHPPNADGRRHIPTDRIARDPCGTNDQRALRLGRDADPDRAPARCRARTQPVVATVCLSSKYMGFR
jgi:hypothetical protein